MSLAPCYRQYDLPWSPSAEVEQRFRKIIRNCLIVFAVFALVIPLLPLPEKAKSTKPILPERVVKLVIEQKITPPPPKPVEPEKEKEVPRPVDKQVNVEPKPAPDRTEQARKQAKAAFKAFDVLNDLHDNTAVTKAQQNQNLSSAVAETRSERNMVTSNVGKGSGGINSAALSRGYGGSSGELANHTTAQVTSTIGAANQPEIQRGTSNKKGSRNVSDVLQILDSNKGAIFALYTRALRTNPDLMGKVVLKLVIAPGGEVTSCQIVSSELANPELEGKLVARIKSIHFPAQDVGVAEVTYPIEFFPAG